MDESECDPSEVKMQQKRRSFSGSVTRIAAVSTRRSSCCGISGERARGAETITLEKSVKEIAANFTGASIVEPEILFQQKIRQSLPFAQYTKEDLRSKDSPSKLKFMNKWSNFVIFEDGSVTREAATSFLAQYGITKDASDPQSWQEWEEAIVTVETSSAKKKKQHARFNFGMNNARKLVFDSATKLRSLERLPISSQIRTPSSKLTFETPTKVGSDLTQIMHVQSNPVLESPGDVDKLESLKQHVAVASTIDKENAVPSSSNSSKGSTSTKNSRSCSSHSDGAAPESSLSSTTSSGSTATSAGAVTSTDASIAAAPHQGIKLSKRPTTPTSKSSKAGLSVGENLVLVSVSASSSGAQIAPALKVPLLASSLSAHVDGNGDGPPLSIDRGVAVSTDIAVSAGFSLREPTETVFEVDSVTDDLTASPPPRSSRDYSLFTTPSKSHTVHTSASERSTSETTKSMAAPSSTVAELSGSLRPIGEDAVVGMQAWVGSDEGDPGDDEVSGYGNEVLHERPSLFKGASSSTMSSLTESFRGSIGSSRPSSFRASSHSTSYSSSGE